MIIREIYPKHIDLEGAEYMTFNAEVYTNGKTYFLDCAVEAAYHEDEDAIGQDLTTIDTSNIEILDGHSIDDMSETYQLENKEELEELLNKIVELV